MFFGFRIKDIIDIFLVAIILYQTYRLMKGTGAANVFIGVLSFVVFWFLVTHVFEMELLGLILNNIMNLVPILLIVIFQEEIRRFFFLLGNRSNWKFLKKVEGLFKGDRDKMKDLIIMQVVTACRKMSKNKTGALIVIERNVALTNYIETGEVINADINARLLENIFFKNSPLHDGALIISGNRIQAAGCILPVSHSVRVPKYLGLRHRSALGIAEKTDAIAIVVSEETGRMSVAENGTMRLDITTEELENMLAKEQ